MLSVQQRARGEAARAAAAADAARAREWCASRKQKHGSASNERGKKEEFGVLP